MFRLILLTLVSVPFSVASFASEEPRDFRPNTDPRETSGYHVLFDLDAVGSSEIVDGYGAYFEWFDANPAKPFFRYCDNFEGSGLKGRPNKARIRRKHIPYGSTSATGYLCHDYSPSEVAAGHKLIAVGSKYLFAVRSENWNRSTGGDVYFQIAKKLPAIGSATYKMIQVHIVRSGESWRTETRVPRMGSYPTAWMRFAVTSSGLGIPNGIDGLTLNPGMSDEHVVSIDDLAGARAL